jgi:hypothetical protein
VAALSLGDEAGAITGVGTGAGVATTGSGLVVPLKASSNSLDEVTPRALPVDKIERPPPPVTRGYTPYTH